MLTLSLNKVFRLNASLRLAFFKSLGCFSVGKTMTCDTEPVRPVTCILYLPPLGSNSLRHLPYVIAGRLNFR